MGTLPCFGWRQKRRQNGDKEDKEDRVPTNLWRQRRHTPIGVSLVAMSGETKRNENTPVARSAYRPSFFAEIPRRVETLTLKQISANELHALHR